MAGGFLSQTLSVQQGEEALCAATKSAAKAPVQSAIAAPANAATSTPG